MSIKLKNAPKILGLDISTKTIGWALFDLSATSPPSECIAVLVKTSQ